MKLEIKMPEKKYCPRCYREFLCDSNNVDLCECLKILMSEEEREKISAMYSDCLCVRCLEELLNDFRQKKS